MTISDLFLLFLNFRFLQHEFTSQNFCQSKFQQRKFPEQKVYKHTHSKTHCKNAYALATTTKPTWQFLLLGTALWHAFYYTGYA